MVATLLLRLKGPLQSWGFDSRYSQRTTGSIPSKSGVLGLLAAAEGRRRADPVSDLAQLRFAVRVDQPGSLIKDFQTYGDRSLSEGATGLVDRYYLEDAVFIAGVEGPDVELLSSLERFLNHPRYPLYLGRRSCPVSPDLVIGVKETDVVTALQELPWQASTKHRQSHGPVVELPIYRDGNSTEDGMQRQDVPVSFDTNHRQYVWRTVIRDSPVIIDNADHRSHDPFFEAVMSA